MDSAAENNTSGKTQRYKSLFHSLPDTFNFKQVILCLICTVSTQQSLRREMTVRKHCDWMKTVYKDIEVELEVTFSDT